MAYLQEQCPLSADILQTLRNGLTNMTNMLALYLGCPGQTSPGYKGLTLQITEPRGSAAKAFVLDTTGDS